MLIISVITDWKVTGCQEDHAGMVPGLWLASLHLRSQMFCCELTWGHDECKPAQDKRNRKQVMTSHYSPTSALMMSFLLSGVSFYLLLFNQKPHLLCCSFLHIFGFILIWIPVYTSLFLEMYLYICISVSCWHSDNPPDSSPRWRHFDLSGFKLKFVSVRLHQTSIKTQLNSHHCSHVVSPTCYLCC